MAGNKSIERGDSANTTTITISSHAGTHIDLPRHFCPGGATVQDITADSLTISPVYCLSAPVPEGEPLRIAHIEDAIERCRDAAGILIRTGMHAYRDTDPARYCTRHPWVHPEIPPFLLERCPGIRIFGTDAISISSPDHRQEGRECHRAFLCSKNPVILAEDLDLSNADLVKRPLVITIYPWIIDELDGVPVLAFADTE